MTTRQNSRNRTIALALILSILICALIALTILLSIGKISASKFSSSGESAFAASAQANETSATASQPAQDDLLGNSVSATEMTESDDHLRISMSALMQENKATALKAKAKKDGGFEIDPDKPMVALTFDDGPSSANTERILEILKKNKCHATFFVLGSRVKSNAKLIRKTVKQGHQVVGHSWDHTQLTKLSQTNITLQLTKTNAAIKKVTGITPKIYRPPYGSINNSLETVSKAQGMSMILWSIDTLDWKYRNTASINSRTMSVVRDGSIILCHDIHPTTAAAMEKVIPALVKKGYQLVTVDELMKAKKIKMKPGKRYTNG